MTEPLFDLFVLPQGDARPAAAIDTQGTFVLRARLSTIITFCDSGLDALRRVRAELSGGSKSTALLHHNGKGRWAGTVHGIRAAVAPLGTEV